MKYPYHVKYNGVVYPPYTEIPNGKENDAEETKATVTIPTETFETTEIVEEKKEETPVVKPTKKHTKNEINHLPIAELRKLAKENGIGNIEGKSGLDLKRALIEKLGI